MTKNIIIKNAAILLVVVLIPSVFIYFRMTNVTKSDFEKVSDSQSIFEFDKPKDWSGNYTISSENGQYSSFNLTLKSKDDSIRLSIGGYYVTDKSSGCATGGCALILSSVRTSDDILQLNKIGDVEIGRAKDYLFATDEQPQEIDFFQITYGQIVKNEDQSQLSREMKIGIFDKVTIAVDVKGANQFNNLSQSQKDEVSKIDEIVKSLKLKDKYK